ncbi:MAG: glycosyltransferase family 39 protein [Bryobacteraceae bacterium]
MRLFGSRSLAWFLLGYAVVLLLLLPVLSIWLDEGITLATAYKPNLRAMLDYIHVVAGSTPLTFLPPYWASFVFGQSAFSARFPSALASWAACPAVFLLARRMQLKSPLLAVVLFAMFPLQLRYALEARPYALAICFVVWATELFLSILDRPRSNARVGLYALFFALAALAQPYAAFVAGAHFLWTILYSRKHLYAPCIALALAALAIGPWYATYSASWALQMAQEQLATWSWRSGLVFLREISGSGYIGSAILFTGIAFGVRRVTAPQRFWLFWAIIPLLALPVVNLAFNYFFAIRQVVFVLPVLVLLFLAGAESLGKAGRCMIAAFVIASLWGNVSWFRRPREDWKAAANAMAAQVSQGGCVIFLGDSEPLYRLFRPELERCAGDSDRVVIGTIPYGPPTYDRAIAPLVARGMVKQSEQSFNGPRVVVFAK